MTITYGPNNTPLQPTTYEALWEAERRERAFLKEMEGRQYGDEETQDARAWFYAGWNAGRKNIPDKKEYQHGRDFFAGEGQEEANAKVDGWNECRKVVIG